MSYLVSSAAPPTFGPLWHEFSLTLRPGNRTEVLGPLWSSEAQGGMRIRALHPIWDRVVDPELERTETDVLYPLFTYDRFGAEYRWQILQLLNGTGGQALDGPLKERLTLFPFVFRQKTIGPLADPKLDYFALVPFYGRMRNHLFRDEIRFAAFPLWLQSRKREVVTDNYLFPFFHHRTGGGVEGWQFLPLAGHETKSPRLFTNILDEVEVDPGHRRTFALWPFFLREQKGLGTSNILNTHAFLPMFTRTRSPLRDQTTYLWPFFSHTVDREKGFEEWGAPYPFIGWANGPGKQSRRFFPIYGHAQSAVQTNDFLLWPLYIRKTIDSPNLHRERTRVMFFGYDDVRQREPSSPGELHRRNLWPLFTYRKEMDGRERLQFLAPLEPFLPNNATVSRLYSPVWSLWRSEKNPQTQRTSRSLLWNLWRYETEAESTRVSGFFGLVQREKTAGQTRWHWFRIRPTQSRDPSIGRLEQTK